MPLRIGLLIWLVSFAGLLPASADPGGVEVLRGAETDSPSMSGRRPREQSGVEVVESNGVEILYGIEPGSSHVDFETESFALSSAERRGIRLDVLAMLDVYAEELGIRVAPEFAVDLNILGDPRMFEERSSGERRLSGFHHHRSREAVVSGAGSVEHIHRTAVHESSHAILGDQVPAAPPWLNEGLAEYFERIERWGGRPGIPPQPRRLAQLAAAIDTDAAWPLQTLLELRPRQWAGLDELARELAYSQAWALVYFFMEDGGRREVLRTLLAEFAGGAAATSSPARLQKLYPGGMRALDRDWLRWASSPAQGHRY